MMRLHTIEYLASLTSAIIGVNKQLFPGVSLFCSGVINYHKDFVQDLEKIQGGALIVVTHEHQRGQDHTWLLLICRNQKLSSASVPHSKRGSLSPSSMLQL